MATRVLVVDDDPLFLKLSRRALERAGAEVTLTGSIAEARARMFNHSFDVAILDYFLRRGECGCDLIPVLRGRYPGVRVVVLSGLGAVAEVIHHAHAAGADLVESKTRVDWDLLIRGPDRPAAQAGPTLNLAALRLEIIHGALLVHRYNISATARALGVKRSTLQRALRRTPALRSDRGWDPAAAEAIGMDRREAEQVGMEAGSRGDHDWE